MNKILMTIILSVVTMFSAVSFSYASEDNVEISFKVGESILKINGSDTEVETPYVAGDGTTLVPLRVITEAFGAEVDWEDSTKTITLTYPDVNIVLQIGNIIAHVNDHSETLLEAPALSENGVTMVPLRFISETFGATVGYDNETGAILVTKKKTDNTQMVTGVTEMSRTGDSYYKWSIDTPTQMQMTERRSDGLFTRFTADNDSTLTVEIYKDDAETQVPFDEEFSKLKSSFSNYTLIEAEQPMGPLARKYMHFQAKDKEDIIDVCEYYGDNYYRYRVVSVIKIEEDSTVKDMILSVSGSFGLGGLDSSTYDLSNVSGGMRTVKDDKYKITLKIPADFAQLEESKTENEFRFFSMDKDNNSVIHLGIYSKTEEVTAQLLAQSDREARIKATNPDFSDFGQIEKTEDGKYRYTHTISGSSNHDMYIIDSFMEIGDYVYNLSVQFPKNQEGMAQRIVSSFEAEPLDSAKIGKLIRNDPDNSIMTTKQIGTKYTIKLPSSWSSSSGLILSANAQGSAFMDSNTGSMLSVTVGNNKIYKPSSLEEEASLFRQALKKKSNNKMKKGVELLTVGPHRWARFSYLTKDDNGAETYVTVHMTIEYEELIVFSFYEPDVFYQEMGNEALKKALESFAKT